VPLVHHVAKVGVASMLEKKELIRGTKQELLDYFFNDLKIVKYENRLQDLIAGIQVAEHAELTENSIKNNIERISKCDPPIGIVPYLYTIQKGHESYIKIETKFIYIAKD